MSKTSRQEIFKVSTQKSGDPAYYAIGRVWVIDGDVQSINLRSSDEWELRAVREGARIMDALGLSRVTLTDGGGGKRIKLTRE